MKEIFTAMIAAILCISMFSILTPIAEAQTSEPKLIDIFDHFGYTNVTLEPLETFPPGLYEVSLLAEFAYDYEQNELGFYVVNTTTHNLLFPGPEGQNGYDDPPIEKIFSSARKFGLFVYNPRYGRFFTQESMNPDGQPHSLVYRDLDSPDTYFIGFEDSELAKDIDYNDMVISLTHSGNASVYVFVNAPIFDDLSPYISRYVTDLEEAGQNATAHKFSGTSNELKNILKDGYSEGVRGCLLIGDIPIVWYEMSHTPEEQKYNWPPYEKFPTDLFYMDLNGEWTDTDGNGIYDRHTGNRSAEIWVGRLKASNMMENETSLLQNYFDKDHNFRTGFLSLPYRALTYVDDPWAGSSNDIDYAVSFVYDNRTLIDNQYVTNSADYLSKLGQDWNLVQVSVHGWPNGHAFQIAGLEDGYVYSSDIRNNDPHAFFYNLFSCSNAKYSDTDYIAGWYIFSRSYGVVAVSSTKAGGMLEFEDFYREFRTKTLGESFLNWLNRRIEVEDAGGTPWWSYDSKWYYGMTVLGDPTLYSSYNSTTTSVNPYQPETVNDANLQSSVLHVSPNGVLGEYPSIQEAINAANSGDLIEVAAGTYDEHLNVNKSVRIFGQKPEEVFLVSNKTGPLLLVTADNVEIRSLVVKAFPTGPLEISQIPIQTGLVIYSNNNTIQNNKIVDCNIGIKLSHCYGNIVTDNRLENCSQSGIYACDLMNSNMTGNVVANGLIGVFFFECGNATFSNNTFVNDTHMFIQYSRQDVSLTEVEAPKTVLGQTQSMPVNVTVENHGNFSATFDVTLYANETAIDALANVTLSSGNLTILTFNWNTTRWSIGNYTVWAYAEPLQGETNTQDNLIAGRAIYMSIMGDINADGKVNIFDVSLAGKAFGAYVGSLRWDSNSDINSDGTVNVIDLTLIAREYGKHS